MGADGEAMYRAGLVDDIIASLPAEIPAESKDYVKRMCVYTCYGGKMNRGVTVEATLSAVKESKGALSHPRSQPVSRVAITSGYLCGWGSGCLTRAWHCSR